MQFVVFFVKVAWFLGGSTYHLDSIGNKILFFCFVSCQRCWSINCFDQNTFIYITGLYCVSINSLPVLPMTVCFISMFSAATLLLR